MKQGISVLSFLLFLIRPSMQQETVVWDQYFDGSGNCYFTDRFEQEYDIDVCSKWSSAQDLYHQHFCNGEDSFVTLNYEYGTGVCGGGVVSATAYYTNCVAIVGEKRHYEIDCDGTEVNKSFAMMDIETEDFSDENCNFVYYVDENTNQWNYYSPDVYSPNKCNSLNSRSFMFKCQDDNTVLFSNWSNTDSCEGEPAFEKIMDLNETQFHCGGKDCSLRVQSYYNYSNDNPEECGERQYTNNRYLVPSICFKSEAGYSMHECGGENGDIMVSGEYAEADCVEPLQKTWSRSYCSPHVEQIIQTPCQPQADGAARFYLNTFVLVSLVVSFFALF